MKVEHSGSHHIMSDRLDSAHHAENTRAPGSAPSPAARDQAALSERARLLSKGMAALDEVPEVRQERVTTLRQQVESGAYQVPYEGLATRLLAKKVVE